MNQVRVHDAYEDYISRRRAAEEAERDRAARRRKPRTNQEALIPQFDLRERFGDALAGLQVNERGDYELRGPLCSDGLHSFVVCLSPYGVSPREDWPSRAAGGVFTGAGALLVGVPMVGWLLATPCWILGALFSSRANRNRLAPEKRLREAEQSANQPWRWWLTRTGPEPWASVVVDDYQLALNLGIHHPSKDVSDGWLVSQVEKSLSDAVAMAKRVLEEFTY